MRNGGITDVTETDEQSAFCRGSDGAGYALDNEEVDKGVEAVEGFGDDVRPEYGGKGVVRCCCF